MSVEKLYGNIPGRFLLKVVQKMGLYRITSKYLRTVYSKCLISRYIKKHNIDMSEFEGQEYKTFAEFFARKKESNSFLADRNFLISPCDGMLSIYQVSNLMNIPMKGSTYRLTDLIPDRNIAKYYRDGLCLVFRLQAKDYHHFITFDDATILETNFVKGQLNSVMPIACEKVHVFKLNRRWWSILETKNFGRAVQIEVGAMMVGGVKFTKNEGWLWRGEEMGNFEIAGSTIVVLLSAKVRRKLEFLDFVKSARRGEEVPVKMGEGVAVIKEN